MAKWMSDEFVKGLSKKVKDSITESFKELAKEYNSLKKVEQLPTFIKKVWDYYSKANKYEVCLINLLEPGIGYAHDLSEIDETAKDKFFKQIEAFSKIDGLETIIPFPNTFSIPRCVRMFKDADGYEIDVIENEEPELFESDKEKSDEKNSSTDSGTSSAGSDTSPSTDNK